MTRLLIGFFFGLMVAAAVGQTTQGQSPWNLSLLDKVLMAAADPNGKAAVIKVDAEGRVICSPESPR